MNLKQENQKLKKEIEHWKTGKEFLRLKKEIERLNDLVDMDKVRFNANQIVHSNKITKLQKQNQELKEKIPTKNEISFIIGDLQELNNEDEASLGLGYDDLKINETIKERKDLLKKLKELNSLVEGGE